MSQGREGMLQVEEQPFMVHSERTEGGERIRVLGEMDLSVVGLLDSEMRRAEASDASRIVLDLDQLEFLDASGIRLLLDLNSRSERNGGRLRIRPASSQQVQRVLELTGVRDLLPFED